MDDNGGDWTMQVFFRSFRDRYVDSVDVVHV